VSPENLSLGILGFSMGLIALAALGTALHQSINGFADTLLLSIVLAPISGISVSEIWGVVPVGVEPSFRLVYP